LARSRARGGRPRPVSPSAVPAAAPSLAAATSPRVWQSVGYRALTEATSLRGLFDFAAAAWPPQDPCLAWGATIGPDDRLVGGVVAERDGDTAMLYGPLIVDEDGSTTVNDRLDMAAQLVAAAIEHARALGIRTAFARPQGVDRIWVRFGFIPLPESTLPAGLRGRPGAGLFAWRGGSALWTLRESG